MKRFYEKVELTACEENYAIMLDGKKVKTPAGQTLCLPSKAAAQLVACEFMAQGESIDPAAMPVTRIANTVLDGIISDPQPILEDILRMAAHDLLFYRAKMPRELAERQSERWDNLLDRIYELTGAHFYITDEISYIAQPASSLKLISAFLRGFASSFAIGALHVMSSLTHSALLALLLASKNIALPEAWSAAHLEEDWTNEQWGADSQAAASREHSYRQLKAAYELLLAL